MKKFLLALLAFASANVLATDSYFAGLKVATLSVRTNNVLFSVTGGTPPNTCNHYNFYFNVDISTPGGKNMYAALLTAKSNDTTISLAYTDSTTPNVLNCDPNNMAKPWAINLN